MPMIRIFSLAALAAGAGCRPGPAAVNNKANITACTVKLSGALTATSSCTAGGTYARIVLGQSDLDIQNTGDSPRFDLTISKTGQLVTGTITESSSGVTTAVTIVSNGSITRGGLLWDQSTQDPAHGSVTVNLTSVSLASDGYTFTIHGTADATLTASPATPGATGTVMVHVDF